MPGPPPKPTRLKILAGNPGKRKLNKREPQFKAANRPTPPAWLSRIGKAEWRRVVTQLSKVKGLLQTVDLSLLAVYCDTYAAYRKAQQFLDKQGETYVMRDKDGQVKYVAQFPQVSIVRAAADQLRKLAGEFGFSPASRSRLQIKEPEPESDFQKMRNERTRPNAG